MKAKQLKLNYKISTELYLFLSKVIGKKQSKYYVNTLNCLFKTNSTFKPINILMSFKLAIDEDRKLFTSGGKELEKLIKIATRKSNENVRSILQIEKINSNIKWSKIIIDLNVILFEREYYEEYKSVYSDRDYHRIILMIDIVIRDIKQNKFKDNILNTIDSLIVLAGFSITELVRLRDSIEVWTTGICMDDSKASLGGWAYVIDMKRVNNTEIIGHDASSMTTGYEQSLIAVKEGIEHAMWLGFKDIIVHTDSELVAGVYIKCMHIAGKNGWSEIDNTQLNHLELIKSLYNLFSKEGYRITFKLEEHYKKAPLYIKTFNLALVEIKSKQVELNRLEKQNPKEFRLIAWKKAT